MKKRPIQHQLNGLMALLLFGVFAACVLAVLLTGASAYRRLTQRDQEAYLRRTCVQYLATRVRQADSRDRVSVESFGGADALVLTETDGSYLVFQVSGGSFDLSVTEKPFPVYTVIPASAAAVIAAAAVVIVRKKHNKKA